MKPGQLRRLQRKAKAYKELPGTPRREEGKKEPKKQSPWSLGCLIPAALLLLVTAGIAVILLMG